MEGKNTKVSSKVMEQRGKLRLFAIDYLGRFDKVISRGVVNNLKELTPIVNKCIDKYMNGNTGEYEKYAEDLENMAKTGAVEGMYQLDKKYSTPFGDCDKLCITPNGYDKIITIYFLQER